MFRNQGFLHFYQLKQLPNFALAVPMTLLSATTLFPYLSCFLFKHFFAKTSKDNSEFQRNNPFFNADKAFVYVVYHLGLFVISLLFMHVQVMTRYFSLSLFLFFFMFLQNIFHSFAMIVVALFLLSLFLSKIKMYCSL